MELTFSFIGKDKNKIYHYSRILPEEKYSQINNWEHWKQKARLGLKLQIPTINEDNILVIIWEKKGILPFKDTTKEWLKELIKS